MGPLNLQWVDLWSSSESFNFFHCLNLNATSVISKYKFWSLYSIPNLIVVSSAQHKWSTCSFFSVYFYHPFVNTRTWFSLSLLLKVGLTHTSWRVHFELSLQSDRGPDVLHVECYCCEVLFLIVSSFRLCC